MRNALVEYILKSVLYLLAGNSMKIGDIQLSSGNISDTSKKRVLKSLVELDFASRPGKQHKIYSPKQTLMELFASYINNFYDLIAGLYDAIGTSIRKNEFVNAVKEFLNDITKLEEETKETEKV